MMRRATVGLVILATLALQAEAKRKRPTNVGRPEEAVGEKFEAYTLGCRDYYDFIQFQASAVAIETPRYPSNYPNRRRCSWKLNIPPNANVSVYCEKFDVHRSDSFCIYDSNNFSQDCWYGSVNYGFSFPFSSSSDYENYIHMTFRSNRRNNAGGFRCLVSVEDGESTPSTETTEEPVTTEEPFTTVSSTSGPTTAGPTTAAPTTAAPTTAAPTTTGAPSQCNCGLVNRVTRIVGGSETEVNEYPWQVGLVSSSGKTPWCGGSILDSTHILTAAHCTAGSSTSSIRVLLGEHNTLDNDYTIVNIAAINDHPDYNSITLANDFSILTLASPITFTTTMRPVCLPAVTAEQYVGATATITGWGTLSSGGSLSSTLQEVDVNVLSNSQCSNSYSGITSVNVCAASPGKDSCQGDSGGPMVVSENNRYAQIGVVSYGIGCANPSYPGVYARVTAVKSWIQGIASGAQNSNC